MVLPVITYPNDILRKPASRVSFPLDKQTLKLVRDMLETVKAADGIGLAAPQVGKSLQLVVIDLEKNGMPPIVLFNPKIVSRSLKKTEVEEGCLSLPGIWGVVKRPVKVKIEAQDLNGKKIRFTDEGWVARVAQHEIDHLNGVLIIDLIKKYTQGQDTVDAWKSKKLK